MLRRPAWLTTPRHLTGRLALTGSLQLLLVAGSLGWFTYSLGRRSGLAVSEQMRQIAAVQELSRSLSHRLEAARTITALNLLEISSGEHPLTDYAHFARLFWRQMQVFPVAYINFGGRAGDFVGVERSADGQLLLNEDTARLGRGRMAVSHLGRNGSRGALIETIPGLTNLHEEAWYADTVRAGRPTWSAIYSWEDKPEVFSISYNAPVYGAGRQLQGVVGVDMVLTQLSAWLSQLWRHHGGLALIVEPNGRLVASSRPELTLTRADGRVQRASIAALRDPIARALLTAKFQRPGGSAPGPGATGELQLRPGVLAAISPKPVTVGEQTLFIDASPWGQREGLNWVLLTAVPAEPRTRASERATTIALVASGLALLLAAWSANLQLRGLLRPLEQLRRATTRLSDSLDRSDATALRLESGIGPADGLEMQELDRAIGELVEHFKAASAELAAAAERERQRDAQTLALLQQKLRSSLEAAAVAHEINQPLSTLLLNSQLLLEQVGSHPNAALPAAWRQQLQGIHDQAQRVVVTIEAMRTLLRNVQTEHQPIDLRSVARSAVLYVRSGGSADTIRLDTTGLDGCEQPAWMHGDAVQLQIAIVNLLRNGLQAVEQAGGPDPWVAIGLERCGEAWQLSVADNGPGFPADWGGDTLLRTSKPSGSGLGLFVVRTTVENHHGSIQLQPRPGGGALVLVRLPADPPTTGD